MPPSIWQLKEVQPFFNAMDDDREETANRERLVTV